MGVAEAGYELLMRGAPAVLRAAAPFHEKLRRGLAGRAAAREQLRTWGVTQRERGRPLVWLHAPSVGEALMTQAIVDSLRAQRPDLQIAFTHFSPSAEAMRQRVRADVAAYLPWDDTASMQDAIDAMTPDLVAFVRSEIWPTLARLVQQRNRSALLVNAVLSPGSRRLGRLARAALGPAYQRLDAVGAIDAAAAGRFARLGVPAARVSITGDARFDQVWARVQQLDRARPLLQRLADPAWVTVVAGSTWPSDEVHLCAAFARLSGTRLILAPHEPTEAHLLSAERILGQAQLSHGRLAQIENSTDALPRVVLVDRVGVLADLYAIADLAFVGGAFHRAGVHSVVEPAALGVPVLFGPQHTNAAEAAELVEAGGAFSVADGPALFRALSALTATPAQRVSMGACARAFVTGKLGGARRNAELILQWLDRTAG